MPYRFRGHHRFTVSIPLTYEHRFHEGQGTVWNLSPVGWRISGDLPLQPGDVCSIRVLLPTSEREIVAAGRVRWARGHDCGIATLVMSDESEAEMNRYIQVCINASS